MAGVVAAEGPCTTRTPPVVGLAVFGGVLDEDKDHPHPAPARIPPVASRNEDGRARRGVEFMNPPWNRIGPARMGESIMTPAHRRV
ncbi:MAG: hypothetical protein HBSAPP03_00350 [Phycisphaerae bacterium]|nr:MAG: hypothetical protein HBSAPP03_00350 [Phycisphaerae bacterium]